MQLAGRLRRTTLGDLLGTLYRARVTGVLELAESARRDHRIHLAEGRIFAVETPAHGPPLGVLLRRAGLLDASGQRRLAARMAQTPGRLTGELLLEERLVSRPRLDAVLRAQLLERLEALFRLSDATVTFHVAEPRHRAALSPILLSMSEYLHGRPRARDRQGAPRREPPPRSRIEAFAQAETPRARALRTLGLPREATRDQITRAFRRLASEAHPDRFPNASPEEKQRQTVRFAELAAAYHLLVR